MKARAAVVFAMAALLAAGARAADFPTPQQADWTAADFHFHDGAVLPALKIHYTTIGAPGGLPVLILHGTAQTGAQMLSPIFAGELFGPGQPLDAAKYFIILPDSIGAGASSKPSDGLRAKFPRYDYDDMVSAQYRLLTEGLGLHHLRLVLGNSMGGMVTWRWGIDHPDFMDALAPMASQPSAMAARNWIMRRMLIESIRQDPVYNHGDYVQQPPSMRLAFFMFGFATSGGTLALQHSAPTHAQADQIVDARLAAPAPADANDFIYQWDASADYDPAPSLGQITAPVLAINSADDERNPVETGVMQAAMTHVPHGQLYVIPASTTTRGHGTTELAHLWAPQLRNFLQSVPEHPPM